MLDRYNALNAAGKKFQVVFVDAGDDLAEFQENFSGMPWLAVPHSNLEVNGNLCDKFQSDSVPHLAIVQVATGKTITIDAVLKIEMPDFLEEFPFPIKKLSDIR
jgi:nucleoredoxin